jgi:hypothetical protein
MVKLLFKNPAPTVKDGGIRIGLEGLTTSLPTISIAFKILFHDHVVEPSRFRTPEPGIRPGLDCGSMIARTYSKLVPSKSITRLPNGIGHGCVI